jgi:hypothetical protein
LHIGEGQDNSVDLTTGDEALKFLDAQWGCAVCHGKASFGFYGQPEAIRYCGEPLLGKGVPPYVAGSGERA